MTRPVVIRLRAEEDVRKAQLWYERHHPGLGDQFIDKVSRAIKTLETDADRFSIYYRNFRRILLPRFPYKLFYMLDGERAVVFRVLHAKRNHLHFLAHTEKPTPA